MSGHSKWAKIKRAKGAADLKRGAVYTKLGNQITIAAKNGGGDPIMNFVLRLAIEKAKAENMPKDNIQKAIDRGLGVGKDAVIFENITYEALYGGDIMLMIDTLTDSKNRTITEVKRAVEGSGGTMGAANSVAWQFDEKGRVSMYIAKVAEPEKYGAPYKLVRTREDRDEVMMKLLEIQGVEDVQDNELGYESNDETVNDGNDTYPGLYIITEKQNLNTVYKAVEALGYKVESFEVVQIPKQTLVLEGERQTKFENLLSNLEDLDDVQNVWTNVEGY